MEKRGLLDCVDCDCEFFGGDCLDAAGFGAGFDAGFGAAAVGAGAGAVGAAAAGVGAGSPPDPGRRIRFRPPGLLTLGAVGVEYRTLAAAVMAN